MNFTHCTCALAIVLVLAGCGSGESYSPKKTENITPVKLAAGEEKSMLPIKEGAQWVYTSEANGKKDEITLRATNVRSDGDGTAATFDTTNAEGTKLALDMKVDSTGVYQLTTMTGKPYTPAQPLILFPLDKATKEFTLTGPYPIDGEGTMKVSVKYLGTQEVDTDMERMSAFAVESLTTWTSADGPCSSHAVTWWVPGIGFVRQRQEITTPKGNAVVLMKLKSYSAN